MQYQQEIEKLEVLVSDIDYLFQDGVVMPQDQQDRIYMLADQLQEIVLSIRLMNDTMKKYKPVGGIFDMDEVQASLDKLTIRKAE